MLSTVSLLQEEGLEGELGEVSEERAAVSQLALGHCCHGCAGSGSAAWGVRQLPSGHEAYLVSSTVKHG